MLHFVNTGFRSFPPMVANVSEVTLTKLAKERMRKFNVYSGLVYSWHLLFLLSCNVNVITVAFTSSNHTFVWIKSIFPKRNLQKQQPYLFPWRLNFPLSAFEARPVFECLQVLSDWTRCEDITKDVELCQWLLFVNKSPNFLFLLFNVCEVLLSISSFDFHSLFLFFLFMLFVMNVLDDRLHLCSLYM